MNGCRGGDAGCVEVGGYSVFLEGGFTNVSIVGRWYEDDIAGSKTRGCIGYFDNNTSQVSAENPG